MRRNLRRCLAPSMLMLLFLSGCGPAASGEPKGDTTVQAASGDTAQASTKTYQAPPYMGSEFHADHAEGEGQVQMDLAHTSQGYIGISAVSDTRLKLQVFMGEEQYQYDVPADGTPVIFPLQMGDGTYTFRLMKHVKDKSYSAVYSVDSEVALEDEFQPFLRPSAYVDYDEGSECVRLAADLAAEQENALGVVGAVFDYVCDNIVYDKEKAAKIQKATGYLPVLDDTLKEGKGICFDYASLVAAMLRSQGIPVKMVFGHVSPDNVYHAWNMFYTRETGWVTVSYEVKADSWNRLDLTFSANGADSTFIGDGGNYIEEHYY